VIEDLRKISRPDGYEVIESEERGGDLSILGAEGKPLKNHFFSEGVW